MKNDPVKALQLLAPYIQSLQQFAGNILPADLQNQVDQGLLTPEHAALIVRNQNQNALLLSQSQQRQKLEQQSIQQRQQQEAAQRRSAEITQAVGGWEERIRKTDPDFAVKEKFLLPAIEAEILKQPPRTPQEAVDLADRIYKGVSINLREVLPRRQSISPIPSNTASSHGQAEPRTALEAVTRGIRMTHAPA